MIDSDLESDLRLARECGHLTGDLNAVQLRAVQMLMISDAKERAEFKDSIDRMPFDIFRATLASRTDKPFDVWGLLYPEAPILTGDPDTDIDRVPPSATPSVEEADDIARFIEESLSRPITVGEIDL